MRWCVRWFQVASKYMPVGSTIIGLDLDPIRPIPGCTTLVQDITTTQCRAELKRILKVSHLLENAQRNLAI